MVCVYLFLDFQRYEKATYEKIIKPGEFTIHFCSFFPVNAYTVKDIPSAKALTEHKLSLATNLFLPNRFICRERNIGCIVSLIPRANLFESVLTNILLGHFLPS